MAQPIWNTEPGLVGSYPSLISMNLQLSASAVSPATSVTYMFLSGSLPSGITMTSAGLISGTPSLVTSNVEYTFSVRVTDNLGNIRDRTFILVITGSAIPQFVTPSGSILSTIDSIWVDLPIEISNPDSSNITTIKIKQGTLPPGLEINAAGIIRGYANPPLLTTTQSAITTVGSSTSSIDDSITVISTVGFSVGRPVIFSGSVLGGLVADVICYVKTVLSPTSFTVSSTQYGTLLPVTTDSGFMTVSLPAVSTGEPTIRTYTFTLGINSLLGTDEAVYSITVINQNTPVSQGGPGYSPNTRVPTLLNTRPLTYNINNTDMYYGYYILPPVLPTQFANMGVFQSGNFIAFKAIGHDFDGNNISYNFLGLPSGLTGDTETGWVTGSITLSSIGISQYNFGVAVYKTSATSYTSTFFNFQFTVENEITSTVIWLTDSDLGTMNNGTVSIYQVSAIADSNLEYVLASGELPPNLSLSSDGQIEGRVAFQPTDTYQLGDETATFTFTVQAFSRLYPDINSTKTFTISVYQQFTQATDTLYIKAAPPINDRFALRDLLTNTNIIPDEYLYRSGDIYFGKAESVIYEHAFGIYASDIYQYIEAIRKNHYWRNITLGEIKTAVARDDAGNIIYEVVYSEVIDNLVNPSGVSISNEIIWPEPINLNQGPWYTSVTNIFTDYINVLGQEYYTSLTPGYARTLYPNSLYNMRNRVSSELGQDYNSKILPRWMTSQQLDGSTLGYTQAWVICYVQPRVVVNTTPVTYADFEATGADLNLYQSYAQIVKSNIETLWPYTLNQINFEVDRFSVNKSATYDYDNNTVPAAWTGLPSATPAPNPLDTKDFYVLFPRKTILPDETEY